MKSRRPLALMLAPPRLRSWIYSRFFSGKFDRYRGLFHRAPLAFGTNATMIDLAPGDIISGHIAFKGEYELQLSQTIAKLANQGGLMVDVGANMGYFSLIWATTGADNAVIAFEASPNVAARLRANIAENNMEQRIELVEKAASDQPGVVRFEVGPGEQTGWGGISSDIASGIEVEAVTIDTAIGDAHIAVLKIDVEGADTMVLRGCEKLLRAHRVDHIFFEQNDVRMDQLGLGKTEAAELLESCGYHVVPFTNDEGEWYAYPANGKRAA